MVAVPLMPTPDSRLPLITLPSAAVRASNRVIGGALGYLHARCVGYRVGGRIIHADKIRGHHIARRPQAGDCHARTGVAGNNIFINGAATQGIGGRRIRD